MTNETPEQEQVKWYSAKSILPLVYLVAALLALRYSIVEPYVVPTGSMEPTLKTGDRLYALKCAYDVKVPLPFVDWTLFHTGKLKRGDIVLFNSPENPSITFVKRAVGLPGDKIDFHDGHLIINGQEILKEPHPDTKVMYDIEDADDKTLFIEDLEGVKHYTITMNLTPEQREYQESRMSNKSVTVPSDQFFAIGDNRDNSSDSRYWGFAPLSYLKGKAMFIWFSSWDWRIRFERIGTLLQ
jgi:signal peptidase I